MLVCENTSFICFQTVILFNCKRGYLERLDTLLLLLTNLSIFSLHERVRNLCITEKKDMVEVLLFYQYFAAGMLFKFFCSIEDYSHIFFFCRSKSS
jgi:hypothetical protein